MIPTSRVNTCFLVTNLRACWRFHAVVESTQKISSDWEVRSALWHSQQKVHPCPDDVSCFFRWKRCSFHCRKGILANLLNHIKPILNPIPSPIACCRSQVKHWHCRRRSKREFGGYNSRYQRDLGSINPLLVSFPKYPILLSEYDFL